MAASCSRPSQTESSLAASSPRRLTSGEATPSALARASSSAFTLKTASRAAGSRSASASARSSTERRSGPRRASLPPAALAASAVARIASFFSFVAVAMLFIRLPP